MKYVAVVTAIAALVCGLVAARLWYKSSVVEFGPNWDFEPVDEQLKNMGQFAAIMKAAKDSSNFNKFAARWTAAAVLLSAASNIAGVFL